jgi:parallel beta-helix repeat protein
MKNYLFFIVTVIILVTILPLAGCTSLNVETGIPNTIFSVTTEPVTIPPLTTQAATTAPKTTEPQDTGVYTGGPILINSDKDFNHAHGVSGGTGAATDPYIIEGWTIDASTTDTTAWPYIKAGILIGQTEKNYIIRSCTIVNPTKNTSGMTGITAGNNGKVENCSVEYCYTGIFVGGSNTLITGNTVTNCDTGIGSGMYEQSNVTISQNNISACKDVGIDFNYLDNSLADSNTITGCYTGIKVSTVFSSTASNNIITSNKGAGIEVDATFTNCSATVTGNQVSGSGYEGIAVYCSNNNITNNTVTANKGMGIFLSNVALISDTTSHNLVDGNTVNNNAQDGIRVDCPYNTISNNTAMGNNTLKEYYADKTPRWVDLYVFYLQYNTLENNTYGTSELVESR